MIVVRSLAKLAPMKKIVSTKDAPAAIGPYSQAIRGGSLFFAPAKSRSIRRAARSSRTNPEQTKRVLENITAILKAEH